MPEIFHAGTRARLTKRGRYYQVTWKVDGKRQRRSTQKTNLADAEKKAVAVIELFDKRAKAARDSSVDRNITTETSKEGLSWDRVYGQWCWHIERLGLRPDGLFPSQRLVVKKVPDALRQTMVDWWKKASYEDDLAVLEGRSNTIGGWGSIPGVLWTAHLLQHAAQSAEEKAAVFMRAFIWQTLAQLPADWGGDRASLLNKLHDRIGEAHPHLGGWHHSVRHTLPVSIPGAFEQRPFGFWSEDSDLIFLMAIEGSILSSAWMLVDLELQNDPRRM